MGILTYDKNSFYMDGKPYKIMSGAMHYFRIPREYWRDRLQKLLECGLNTVETYTAWNLHEPNEAVFDFDGMLDIDHFLTLCEEVGLNVIIRPGPYICSEWEFGGLPWWILRYENMPLRCYDEVFLSKVRRYYTALLDKVRPHFASNGGCVTMIQVENEYGSYGDDKKYMRAVAEIYKDLGIDCLYFTSDGLAGSMMMGGPLDEYLAVANFGSRPAERLKKLREYRPHQPAMCGEYWCGWFDHWHEKHHARRPKEAAADFEEFFDADGSFNIYMFHGGTNFGFTSGANYSDKYEPTVTSYDYGAPLSEAGDRTEFYYLIRDAIGRHCGADALPPLTAKETEKAAYGKVSLTEAAYLFDNLDRLSSPIESAAPLYMEGYGQGYGYILYRTVAHGTGDDRVLNITHVRDRAQIFINREHRGTYERWNMPSNEEKIVTRFPFNEEFEIDILCENMGRVNYGPKLLDRKGISDLRIGSGQYHFGWTAYPLPMNDLSGLEYGSAEGVTSSDKPVFLRGYLDIEGQPKDTFIRLDGFTKGFVTVNGFNLGRYFNTAGPQKTLYVPAPMLRSGKNEIVVFESDKTDRLTVEFFSEPDLGEIQMMDK